MRLENIVWDALDPRRLGGFWAAALGATELTSEPEGYEARLELGGEVFLDLCFQRVQDRSDSPARLHPDLLGGTRQAEVVDRLLGLGAEHVDVGQRGVPWVVLADPEGNAFCVMEHRDPYHDTGPIAALPLDSADPDRDAGFWSEITGWQPYEGAGPASLRHPTGRGPVLEFCPEPESKQGKNRLHLDVRPAPGEDVAGRALKLGAHPVHVPGAQERPWRVFTDPSGNEFCVLAASE